MAVARRVGRDMVALDAVDEAGPTDRGGPGLVLAGAGVLERAVDGAQRCRREVARVQFGGSGTAPASGPVPG